MIGTNQITMERPLNGYNNKPLNGNNNSAEHTTNGLRKNSDTKTTQTIEAS